MSDLSVKRLVYRAFGVFEGKTVNRLNGSALDDWLSVNKVQRDQIVSVQFDGGYVILIVEVDADFLLVD